ncbi:MAG: CdaR family protein [Anaerolineae bacterium]
MIRVLLSNAGSLILAFILALLVWFVATSESNPLQEGITPPNGVPVEAVNIPPGNELVGGMNERVQVRLVAPRNSWDLISASDFRAYVDLKGVEPGIRSVPVTVVCARCTDNRARILGVTPKDVAVRLEPSAQRQMDVQVGLLGDAALGFTLQKPVATPSQVTIKGPRSAVESVAQVQARLPLLTSPRADVERLVTLAPLDKDGSTVTGVTVDPPQVTVRVPVEQEQGYRELAVSVVRDITPANGYWISSITVSPTTVTVKGPPAQIKALPGYLQTQSVTATGVNQGFERNVPLVVPDGISVVDPSSGSVTVKVGVDVERSGRTIDRPVIVRGLPPDWQAVVAPARVQIVLQGPVADLNGVDNNSNIQVVLDASGLQPGTQSAVPKIVGVPESLDRRLAPDRVDVTITSPTPAARTP